MTVKSGAEQGQQQISKHGTGVGMREAQKASTSHKELTDNCKTTVNAGSGKIGFPHNTPFGYPILNDQP